MSLPEQRCYTCGNLTGRCEDDAVHCAICEAGPFCGECWVDYEDVRLCIKCGPQDQDEEPDA